MAFRIGHGYDVHAYGAGERIVIGGVDIPYHRGLVAHSDGDVLIHALCDALLGAAALGDIGLHFPDNDPRWRDCDSRVMLREVMGLVGNQGWQLGNADLTLMAEAPKMAPHIPAMLACLAADLACESAQLNIKATTTEGLGFIGRGEGVACHAVALLRR